jgi:hypothetical protein
MKLRLVFVAVFALVMLTLIPVAPAHATPSIFTYTGTNATADFYSTDPSGCLTTYISIFAGKELRHTPPGPVNRGAGAQIYIDQFNFCDLTEAIGVGFTPVSPAEFRVEGSTASSHLNASLDTVIAITALGGYTAPSFNQVAVHLNWTSIVVVDDIQTHGHFRTPGYVVNTHFASSFRFAAASGVISTGATNLTPDPSPNAYISATHTGMVEVTMQ